MEFDYYEKLRARVLVAAREGRATYLPAGARDNRTAQVFIDGEMVGQASTCMHYVRQEDGARTFGECKLVPESDWKIPDHLK